MITFYQRKNDKKLYMNPLCGVLAFVSHPCRREDFFIEVNMGKFIDLTGQKFGRLQVLGRDGVVGGGVCGWVFVCSWFGCVWGLLRVWGGTKSCGCLQRDLTAKRFRTHGHSVGSIKTKEFQAWCGLRRRCYNRKRKDYKSYGGYGIRVCDRWLYSFENFLADMGCAPSPKHTIERIDNDGDYTPENCKWATMKEQCRNKRTNIWIEFNGKKMILGDWATELNVPKSTFYRKIRECNIQQIADKAGYSYSEDKNLI